MEQFVSEWDEELAELVTVSDLSDISEHKLIVIKELNEVLIMMTVECNKGERSIEDLINLLDTIKWLVEL